jgi:hypothetical protein
MPIITDRHQVQFLLGLVTGDRSGYQPVRFPVIMVVPHRRGREDAELENSAVNSVRVYVANVPQEAIVTGHLHHGRHFPDHELYAKTLSFSELQERLMYPALLTFSRAGVAIDFADAVAGDTMHYTTATGLADSITYLPDADYFDLSNVEIATEQLPHATYQLVYQAQYYYRVLSQDGLAQFICIDVTNPTIANLPFTFKHPGAVLAEFVNLTPRQYFSSVNKADDEQIKFYRPFTDILQDIADEQDLLRRLNWVYSSTPEMIPYLSHQLGWDIPFFPKSLDGLRRAMLRRTVEFQNLKGSRLALRSLFRLFGFEIVITDLWWSSDGLRTIRPGERLAAAYADETIGLEQKTQLEPLLVGESWLGFKSFTIPLLFRPQANVSIEPDFDSVHDGGPLTVTVVRVLADSAADVAMQQLATTLSTQLGTSGAGLDYEINNDGWLLNNDLLEAIAADGTLGASHLLLTGKDGVTTAYRPSVGIPPVKPSGATFQRDDNQIQLNFDGYLELSAEPYAGYSRLGPQKIYAFAAYTRYETVVPAALQDLHSNRFEIQVLTADLVEYAEPVTLEFISEFVYKLKAFHSLLEVTRTRLEINDTYAVASQLVGGDVNQRYDTDFGRLQVPPAIIPNIPANPGICIAADPRGLGYKDADINFRLRQLAALGEEFLAWRALTGRAATPTGLISTNQPDDGACAYNRYGQAKLQSLDELRTQTEAISPAAHANSAGFWQRHDVLTPVHGDASTSGLFTLEADDDDLVCDGGDRDFWYRGRVAPAWQHRAAADITDLFQQRRCGLSLGSGTYWSYPIYPKIAVPGVAQPKSRSRSGRQRLSGGATTPNQPGLVGNNQYDFLTWPTNRRPDAKHNAFLARLYQSYGVPHDESLHYSNRGGTLVTASNQMLALQRPSLGIEQPTLAFPGCRLPNLGRLATAFSHPTWQARPWDDAHSTYCGAPSQGHATPTFLNMEMLVDTNGDEYLSFDAQPFTAAANGQLADIENLGSHAVQSHYTDVQIVHKVYTAAPAGNGAISDEHVDTWSGSADYISVDYELFPSAIFCDTAGYLDVPDGHPSDTGIFTANLATLVASGPYDAVFIGLGVPSFTATADLLFKLSSGIRIGPALRLDCNCVRLDCAGEWSTANCSHAVLPLDCDMTPDEAEVSLYLAPQDHMGINDYRLDGLIPSLFEVTS